MGQLYSMTCHGHIDIARFVVKHGADVVAQVPELGSILRPTTVILSLHSYLSSIAPSQQHRARGGGLHHLASLYGRLDLARLPSCSAQGEDELIPLHSASSYGYLDPARFPRRQRRGCD